MHSPLVSELIAALAWALGVIEDDLDPDHQNSLAYARAILKAAQEDA